MLCSTGWPLCGCDQQPCCVCPAVSCPAPNTPAGPYEQTLAYDTSPLAQPLLGSGVVEFAVPVYSKAAALMAMVATYAAAAAAAGTQDAAAEAGLQQYGPVGNLMGSSPVSALQASGLCRAMMCCTCCRVPVSGHAARHQAQSAVTQYSTHSFRSSQLEVCL